MTIENLAALVLAGVPLAALALMFTAAIVLNIYKETIRR